MAIIYSQYFDSLSDGSINGQDNWSVVSGTATVQSTTAYEGKACTVATGTQLDRPTSLGTLSTATYFVRCKKDSASANTTDVYCLNSGASSYCLTEFKSDGHIWMYQNPNWQDTGITYSANTWYLLAIEFDYTNLRYRASLDGGSTFSSYYTFPSGQNNFDQLRFYTSTGSTNLYVDDVEIHNVLGATYVGPTSATTFIPQIMNS
jgi:hypothetical protein